MQGATHRAGGVTACLGGYLLLKNGIVPMGVEPAVSLVIMYPFAIWGSTASDLDHSPGSLWDEVKLVGERSGHTLPSQDPFSRGLSHVLHLTKPLRGKFPKKSIMNNLVGVLDCRHRSWQTHSEFPLILLLMSLYWVTSSSTVTVSALLWQLVITGVILGLIAHLFLDLLTPEGLPFATGRFLNRVLLRKKIFPEKIKIIPHVPPTVKGQPGFFSTGGTWEKKIIFNLLHLINLILMVTVLLDIFDIQLPSLHI